MIDKPITIFILIIVVIIVSIYVVFPKYNDFRGLLVDIGEKEAEFVSKNAYYVEVTRIYAELMQYSDNLVKIDQAIPNGNSLADLVNFLQKTSTANGIVFQGVGIGKGAPSPLTKTGDLKEITMSVNLVGGYDSLKNFLLTLEKSSRLIEGLRYSFTVGAPSKENPKGQQSYPIRLDLKVYYY